VPKSGTHLLERVLCLHPRLYRHWTPTITERTMWKRSLEPVLDGLRPGEILLTHLHYAAERAEIVRNSGVRMLFLIRDPRDAAISQTFYIAHKPDHPLYAEEYAKRFQRILDGVVEADHKRVSLRERLIRFSGWLDGDCLVIRFEDLIGARGGGDDVKQMETLRQIFDYIEIQVDDAWLQDLRSQLFSETSPTFRKGAIGAWKAQFTPEVKSMFKAAVGDILIRYGYEADDNW
jgi:hypothetical protein